MTRVYIVRHAEAEGNLYRRAQGQFDGGLTLNGLAQVRALAGRFAELPVEAVYSSDLTRTMQTAAAIYQPQNLPMVTVPELCEISLGPWEDQSWGAVSRFWEQDYAVFQHEPWNFSLEGAETMPHLGDRIESAVRSLAKKHEGGTIAIVTHGLAIRALMTRLEGLAPQQMRTIAHCDNASIGCLEFDGDHVKVVWRGANEHLGELSTLARQHWWRSNPAHKEVNFWYRAARMDSSEDLALVAAFREDAWRVVHGPESAFPQQDFQTETLRVGKAYAGALCFAMDKDETAGLLALDPGITTEDEIGHIALVYLRPEYRGRGLGVQLIGQAISFYRSMGRKFLRLRVAEHNSAARKMYEKLGFLTFDEEVSQQGKLLVMKLPMKLVLDSHF